MKRFALLVAAAFLLACGPSDKVDPRCSIKADGQHKREIAKAVNGSRLWQTYFEKAAGGGGPVVEFQFTVERTKYRSGGGDYDPGEIAVDFKSYSTKNRRLLYKNDMRVRLKDFVITFNESTTREELQEIAFKATEEKVYPYLNRWVNITAVRAMGSAGSSADEFVSTLTKMIEDQWTAGDLRAAAEEALQQIKGRG